MDDGWDTCGKYRRQGRYLAAEVMGRVTRQGVEWDGRIARAPIQEHKPHLPGRGGRHRGGTRVRRDRD